MQKPALNAHLNDGTEKISARSRPQQERSRLRQAALLDAAETIVAEVGIDGLHMREIARRSSLPIASVYHYYPSTASMVRELSIRHLDGLAALLLDRVAARLPIDEAVEGRGELAALVIDDIADYLFTKPAIAAIWSGLHSNPDLRRLDIADTLANASRIEPYIRRLAPGLSLERANATAVVILQAVSANLLLALELPEPHREAVVEALKAFVITAISGLH